MSISNVLSFYRDSTVLIAGGTGFMGKVLLEKILRSVPVKKIYLLIRHKKGSNGTDRLQTILEDRLFGRVRDPVLTAKIEPIEVDYARADFGLRDEIAVLIREEVNVVFYCIASVKFNEPLKKALETNMGIARNVLSWCETFSSLKAALFTSTFYSNCDRLFVEEKVYTDLPFGSYETCMDMVKNLSEKECEHIKDVVIGQFPNTYAFSKRCAEIMIEKEFSNTLPVGIYRPPIVSSTCREPLTGWTDNFNGVTAYVRAGIDGMIWVVGMDADQEGDFAPVDYCVNAMLVCGYDVYHRSVTRSAGSAMPVYNHTAQTNKCKHSDIVLFTGDSRKHCWERWMWKYCWIATTNDQVFEVLSHLRFLYAGFKDFIATFLAGAIPMNRHFYRSSANRFDSFNRAVDFFAKRSWKSESENLNQLKRHLSPEEAADLYFDLEDIHWPEFMRNSVEGALEFFKGRKQK